MVEADHREAGCAGLPPGRKRSLALQPSIRPSLSANHDILTAMKAHRGGRTKRGLCQRTEMRFALSQLRCSAGQASRGIQHPNEAGPRPSGCYRTCTRDSLPLVAGIRLKHNNFRETGCLGRTERQAHIQRQRFLVLRLAQQALDRSTDIVCVAVEEARPVMGEYRCLRVVVWQK